MANDELEILFRRYASGGDVDALAEVFDRAAPVLLRLARRLAEDRNAADDLVQETFLTVLEAPGSLGPSRPLMPWLVGILVNRARTARRSGRRQLEPERLCERDVQEPDAELLRREHDEALVAAVRELPSNLRVVVEARLAGADSGDLAVRLGISTGALRVRMHRGLERLRRLLPSGLASLFALVVLHSQGLARARVRVLEVGRRHPLAHGATTGASSLGMGAILMLKKLILAAGLLTVLFVSVRLSGAFSSAPEPPEPAQAELDAPLALSTSDAADDIRGAQVRDPASASRAPLGGAPGVPTPSAEAELVLSGRVVGESGEPLAGVQVTLSCFGEWSPRAATVTLDGRYRRVGWVLTTDQEGAFRFEVPAPVQERTRLTIIPDDYHDSLECSFGRDDRPRLEAGVTDLGELGLAEAGVLQGRLLAKNGAPIAGGRLYLSNEGIYTLGHDTWTEPDGSWKMAHVPPGRRGVVARAEGFISSFTGGLEVERNRTVVGIDIVLEAAGELRGAVVDSSGRPLADVRLSATPTEYHETGSTASGSGRTDAKGFFRVFVEDSCAYTLKAELDGFVSYDSARDERRFEPGEADIHLVLAPLDLVDFQVVDSSSGEPVTNFDMAVDFDRGSAVAQGPPRSEVALSRPGHHPGGRFQHGAREGLDLVRIKAPGYRELRRDVAFDETDEDAAARGDTREVRPRMTIRLQPRPVVRGRVLREGEPVEGVLVRLLPGAGTYDPREASQPTDAPFALGRGAVLTAHSDAKGRFRILDSEWGLYSLRIVAADGTGLQRDFVRGAYKQAVDVGDLELEPLASLHGQVTMPGGIPPGGLVLVLDGDGAQLSAMVRDSGSYELRGIPAGGHLLFSDEVRGRLARGDGVPVTLAPGQDGRLDLDLTELLLARVALTLTAGGAPLVGFAVALHPLDPSLPDATSHGWPPSSFGDQRTDAEGHIEGALRATGTSWVELRGPDGQCLSSREEFLVTPGALVERTLDLTCGALEVRLPRDLELPSRARLTLELHRSGQSEPPRNGERSEGFWLRRDFSGEDSEQESGILEFSAMPFGSFELSWRLTDRDAPSEYQDLGGGSYRSGPVPLATGQARIVISAEPTVLEL